MKAETPETRHLTQSGVTLAEELNDMCNAENTVHALHCDKALMDFYRCLGIGMVVHILWVVYAKLYVKTTSGSTMRLGI